MLSDTRDTKKNFYHSKNNFIKKSFPFLIILLSFGNSYAKNTNLTRGSKNIPKIQNNNHFDKKKLTELDWNLIKQEVTKSKKTLWEKIDDNDYNDFLKSYKKSPLTEEIKLNSLNRSIVFNNNRVGPDISWLVPPGLSWSNKYIFDSSIRGHNRRKNNESFFGWNSGDAVGQVYIQPIHTKKSSYGLNLGIRSIYQGSAAGGKTGIGEGLSLGFRSDRELSNTSGMAIGAEQLIHFDGKTDTGRDLYITFSKGWWRNTNYKSQFPLDIATAGLATGKMAEGNIKGLCSDLFGGSGTEIAAQRRLCWAPIFTLSRVFNESFSTFFEYNSKWFLLGTSFAPSKNIPLRGTFAVQISDHIENYKLNNFDSLKWVFRVSLGI